MQKISGLLNQPEYVHAALNHFPLVGLLVATLALLIALLTRSRTGMITGLALVGLLALSALPVIEYGEQGFDRVLSMSDEPGQAFLRYHAELADRWAFLYYVTAGAALLGFALVWKWPKSLVPSSLLSLLLAASSLAAGMPIAKSGGEVRHREFRNGPPPAVKEHH
jgi:ABC-type branched-subunit amino acid transport system permease subunit